MMTKICPSADCYFFLCGFIDDNCPTEHLCVCIRIYAKTWSRKGKETSI